MTEESWVSTLKTEGVILAVPDLRKQHPALSSELHGEGIVDASPLFSNPVLTDNVCEAMVQLLRQSGLDLSAIDVVVGIAPENIVLAHVLADNIRRSRGFNCFSAYLEVDGHELAFKRSSLRTKHARVLLCDVQHVDNARSEMMFAAVTAASGIVLPRFATLVELHSSAMKNSTVVPLVSHPFNTWAMPGCELCAQHSNVILVPQVARRFFSSQI